MKQYCMPYKSSDLGRVKIYLNHPGQDTLFLLQFNDINDVFFKTMARSGLKQCNIVVIYDFLWDESLSPWPSSSCIGEEDHFTGKAPNFLQWIETTVLPYVETIIPQDSSEKILCGYSMAGLFCLYASYFSKSFQRIVCVSGSLWYPNFEQWALQQNFERKPLSIYLSLGKKEIKTQNVYLQTTGHIMETLKKKYQSLGIDSIFEWNPGNHFNAPLYRMILGIRWSLQQQKK